MCLFRVLLLMVGPAVTAVGADNCPSAVVDASCPPSWILWGHSCYRLTDAPHHWYQSMLACHDMGAKMAVPYSPQENEFMMQMAQNETKYWIGCRDIINEGTWECDAQGDGEPYLNWWDGNPENYGDYEHCLISLPYYYNNGNINDHECYTFFRTICVKKQDKCIHHPVQPACGYPPTRARNYCFTTDADGQLLNSCLLDHVIGEFVTKSSPQCASACILEPRCHSFNIKHNHQGQTICQINNATRCNDPAQFQEIGSYCIYAQECIN
ncbi:C-type lectin domain family 4 member E-like [Patiria miniata]|uniref:C-type lectin n=1 Tax=Patiria miniata TaxID=46514 RepID=A0A913Z000_PATMI|nr:C-type lectin domain family 4 member E-like [Patiria miniata]